MTSRPPPQNSDATDQKLTDALRAHEQRARGYRERALKLFPWICGRCGREFAGKRLRELTVHHKDHNHDNNPPDGSNWELLCLYCHDNEHARFVVADTLSGATSSSPSTPDKPSMTHQPFASLGDLLKPKS